MAEMPPQNQGPATDQHNEPVGDPTKNVLDLVRTETRRQDDLRRADARHVRELMKRDRIHARDLRKAEAKRLDATRQVDVNAVAAAAAVQSTQQGVLAAQVTDTAEAARQSVEVQRQATATALEQALEPIRRDVVALRQSQWTGEGGTTADEKRGLSTGVWVGLALAAVFGLLGFLTSVAGLLILLNR